MRGDDLLRHARELVGRGWSKGADARDAAGKPVPSWSEAAASWSMLGALVAATEAQAAAAGEPIAVSTLASACAHLATLIEADSLERWNDAPGRTQAEV